MTSDARAWAGPGPVAIMLLLAAALLPAGAARSGEAGAFTFADADFHWKLELVPAAEGAGTVGREVELQPGGGAEGALVFILGQRSAQARAAGAAGRQLAAAELPALPRTIVLARRGRTHCLVADGRLVLRIEHAGAHSAPPRCLARGVGLTVKEILRQRVEPPVFEDRFSRRAGDAGPWRVRSGPWESAARSWAEHSANPGAVRARFDPGLPEDPFEAGRVHSPSLGLGVHLVPLGGGGLGVARVSGASPAEAAGLRAGDVILSVGGRPAGGQHIILAAGQTVEMEVARAGERQTRKVTLVPGEFAWGRVARSARLPGAGEGREALLVTGHEFWGPCRAECAARSAAGCSVGLAFALAESGGGLVFRLTDSGGGCRAELVRVDAAGRASGEPLAAAGLGRRWPGSWYRLAVEVSDDGRPGGFAVRCLVGDREVLSARSPEAGFGLAGLWAGGERGWAEFDDVAVCPPGGRPGPTTAHFPGFAVAAGTDEFMRGWSAPAGDWDFPRGKAGHAVLHFPCLSGARVRLPELPADGRAEVVWSGEGGEDGCGVRLSAAERRAELFSGQRSLGAVKLPAGAPPEIALSAGRLALLAGGREVLGADVGGGRRTVLSLSPPELARAPGLSVCPVAGLDLGFDRAPVELVTVAGGWGLANRWICDPRWSWFAGAARPLCAAWTARSFSGDQRVELFAAPMMTSERMPHEIARDFGISLCGDGRSLWSGYTAVFGADNNRCTRLYRQGRLVAETAAPEARFPVDFFTNPSRSALHQVWFRLGLELRGGRVCFLVDGRPRLEWTDPQPLAGGRAAFWAMRGGMLVARLRADAERVGELEPDLGGPAPRPPAAPFEPEPRSAPPPEISSCGEGLWRLSWAAGGAGTAARLRGLELDPAAVGTLTFRFRASPGAALDLIMDGDGHSYRLGLTGAPPDERAEEREPGWLGAAQGVAADGQWHAVSVPLGALWRDFWRARWAGAPPPGIKLQLSLGPARACGYVAAGLGGNPPGTWCELSVPGCPAPGRDLAPPRPGKPVLEGNTADRRARLVLPLADPGGSGLDARRLTMTINGSAMKIGSPGVEYSEARGRVSVDLAAAGVRPGPAGEYALTLKGLADRAGNRLADAELTVDVDPAADRRPPERVEVRLLLGGAETELGLGPERFGPAGEGGQCLLRPVWPERCGDPAGIEAVGLIDGSMLATNLTPRGRPFDLARFPEMDIRFRFGPSTPLGAVLAGGRRWPAVVINEEPLLPDGRRAWSPEPPLAADRSWQRASLPLARLVRGAGGPAARPAMPAMRLGDVGELRSRAGTHFSAGGARLVPALRPGDIALAWSAWDASGVTGCRSALDNRPDTVPGRQEIESGKALPPAVTAALAEGDAWLHLSFSDRAGNWSPAEHWRVIVDRSAPRVAWRSPAGETSPRRDGLELRIEDVSGVDPASLVLELDNREFRAGRPGFSFDPGTGLVRLDALAALGRPLAAGEKHTARLSCSDWAGNRADAVIWSWRTVAEEPARPPAAPELRFSAGAGGGRRPRAYWPPLVPGRFSPIRNLRMEREVDEGGPGRAEAAARFERLPGGGSMEVSLEPPPWRLERWRCLRFELKASAGLRLELVLKVSGRPLVVPLTGAAGAAAEGAGEGTWRAVSLDLLSLAREKLGEMPVYCVWEAYLREPDGALGPEKAAFGLRRGELWSGETSGSAFLIDGADAESGLAGFSVVLDGRPDTIPPERVNLEAAAGGGPGRWPAGKLAPGTWWLHARAGDMAGNWSPAAHFRLVVPGAPAGMPADGNDGAKKQDEEEP